MIPVRRTKPADPPAADRPASGTVTRVVAQARRADRVSVYLDDTFAFGIPAEVAVAAGLVKGRFLDETEVVSLRSEGGLHDAKQAALSLLARRAFSEAEMRSRLMSRGHPESVADRVVDRLRELGYLDDARFAASYSSGRFRSKGYGPRRILQDLRRRGVSDAVARQAVSTLQEDVDPVQAALASARKVWPRLSREPDRRKREARLHGYLARRGFDSDTIRAVLPRLESFDPS